MKKLPSLLLLLTLVWGCSAHKSEKIPENIARLKNLTVIARNVKPEYKITFKKDVSYRNTSHVFFHNYNFMAVDSNGKVYVAGPLTIYVFDSNGHYLTHMGRKGKGPGEFEDINQFTIHSDKLYIYDQFLRRITIFSLPSLTVSRTILLTPDKYDKVTNIMPTAEYRKFFVTKNNKLLLGFTKFNPHSQHVSHKYIYYFIADSSGKVISNKFFKQRFVNLYSGIGGPAPFPVTSPKLDFDRGSLMCVTNNGHIYSAWTENFLIREYDLKGKFLHAFYYAYKNSSLHKDRIKTYYLKGIPQIRKALNKLNFPRYWPALSYMFTDDQNRIWVATITNDQKNYLWWVLNPSGKLLAKFKWPGKRINRERRPRNIQVVKNGFLYAFKKDTTTNSDEIVKYRIVMKKSGT